MVLKLDCGRRSMHTVMWSSKLPAGTSKNQLMRREQVISGHAKFVEPYRCLADALDNIFIVVVHGDTIMRKRLNIFTRSSRAVRCPLGVIFDGIGGGGRLVHVRFAQKAGAHFSGSC